MSLPLEPTQGSPKLPRSFSTVLDGVNRFGFRLEFEKSEVEEETKEGQYGKTTPNQSILNFRFFSPRLFCCFMPGVLILRIFFRFFPVILRSCYRRLDFATGGTTTTSENWGKSGKTGTGLAGTRVDMEPFPVQEHDQWNDSGPQLTVFK